MTAYLVLAIVEVSLLVRYIKAGPPETEEAGVGGPPDEESRPLAFAY
jgi:hypothetical protein